MMGTNTHLSELCRRARTHRFRPFAGPASHRPVDPKLPFARWLSRPRRRHVHWRSHMPVGGNSSSRGTCAGSLSTAEIRLDEGQSVRAAEIEVEFHLCHGVTIFPRSVGSRAPTTN